MVMLTFNKVTLISCLFLFVSLLLAKMLLSRGVKEWRQSEVGPGHLPPMMQRQNKAEGQAHQGAEKPYSKAHSPEAYAKAKAGAVSTGGKWKAGLMGQIIPIYAFGILLYILYILFKITSKGKHSKADHRCPTMNSKSLIRNISEHELTKLQEKLRETEQALGQIVRKADRNRRRIRTVTLSNEERLLQRLKEVRGVMQERHLTGGVSPEVEAEHTHYVEAWGGDPKEAYPEYDLPHGGWLSDVVILEEPSALLPTAEEQAEQMEMGEEYMTRGTGVEDNKDSVDNGMGEEEDLHGVDDEEEDIGVNEEEELCGVVEEEEDFDGVDDEEEEEMAEEEDLCGVVNEEEDLEGVGEGEEEERDEEEDLDGVDRVGVNEDTGRVDKREGKKRVAHSCVLIRAWSPMRGRDEEELPVRAPCGQKEGKQISFNNIKEVFCYAVESSTDSNSIQETDEDEDEEEDPVIMAENLEFNSKAYSDLEKQVEEQGDAAFFHITDSEEEGSVLESKRAKAQGLGTLRKRKRREPE